MKYAKNVFIAAFALFFTVAVIGSLWCMHTPEGQQWEKEIRNSAPAQFDSESADMVNRP